MDKPEPRQCAYMLRNCTADCLAYLPVPEKMPILSAEQTHCLRLVLDVRHLLKKPAEPRKDPHR